MTHQNC